MHVPEKQQQSQASLQLQVPERREDEGEEEGLRTNGVLEQKWLEPKWLEPKWLRTIYIYIYIRRPLVGHQAARGTFLINKSS
jgi:hypothetical protein